ncbi:MAG: Uma2 family endonuclease [Saprospiraceae bacterium]|nr:Uma2 family endonuclease [Saprospiraceae bacterium]
MSGLTAAAPGVQPQKDKAHMRQYTIEEYLELEETALVNHEFDNGNLIQMPGGTPQHSLIKANLVTALNNQLRKSGKTHLVFNSDIRIYLPAFNRAVMPDAAVVTGKARFSVEHPVGVLLNPSLVVEVLSDSTESYDRGEKFALYRSLASLEEYVLVSQNEPRVETFVKQNGKWFINEAAQGLEAEAELASLGLKIPIRDLFWNIPFEIPQKKRRKKSSDS